MCLLDDYMNNKKEIIGLSKCCAAEVFVAGRTTKYYVCSKCKQPCDIMSEEDMFFATDDTTTEKEVKYSVYLWILALITISGLAFGIYFFSLIISILTSIKLIIK